MGVLGSLAAVNPPKKMERSRPVIQQYQIPQHVQHRTSPPQQGTKSVNLAAALGLQASPTRPRQHQHQHQRQGSYDARYAPKESYESRSRRDERSMRGRRSRMRVIRLVLDHTTHSADCVTLATHRIPTISVTPRVLTSSAVLRAPMTAAAHSLRLPHSTQRRARHAQTPTLTIILVDGAVGVRTMSQPVLFFANLQTSHCVLGVWKMYRLRFLPYSRNHSLAVASLRRVLSPHE